MAEMKRIECSAENADAQRCNLNHEPESRVTSCHGSQKLPTNFKLGLK